MASLVDAYFKLLDYKKLAAFQSLLHTNLAERTEPAAPPFSFTNLPQTRTAVADELSSEHPAIHCMKLVRFMKHRTRRFGLFLNQRCNSGFETVGGSRSIHGKEEFRRTRRT